MPLWPSPHSRTTVPRVLRAQGTVWRLGSWRVRARVHPCVCAHVCLRVCARARGGAACLSSAARGPEGQVRSPGASRRPGAGPRRLVGRAAGTEQRTRASRSGSRSVSSGTCATGRSGRPERLQEPQAARVWPQRQRGRGSADKGRGGRRLRLWQGPRSRGGGAPGLSVCTSGRLPRQQGRPAPPTPRPPPPLLAKLGRALTLRGGAFPGEASLSCKGGPCFGSEGSVDSRVQHTGQGAALPSKGQRAQRCLQGRSKKARRFRPRLPAPVAPETGVAGSTLTWVSLGGQVHCGPGPQDSSLPPRPSVDAALPPPCPAEWKGPGAQAARWALSTLAAPSPALCPSSRGPHRELELVILIAGQEGPPAFDALLLEDGNQGHVHLPHGHLHGAQLGCLCAPRKAVQVQLDGPCGSLAVSSDDPPRAGLPLPAPLPSPALHPGSRPRRSGRRPRSAG